MSGHVQAKDGSPGKGVLMWQASGQPGGMEIDRAGRRSRIEAPGRVQGSSGRWEVRSGRQANRNQSEV